MKKLFILFAFLVSFLGASAERIVDARVDFSDQPDQTDVYFWGWSTPSAQERLSIHNGCLHFASSEATDPYWDCQFMPIGLNNLEIGETYTLRLRIKGDHSEAISAVYFGGSENFDNLLVPTEWTEVEVQYPNITSLEGGILIQCGGYIGTFDIAWMEISHEGKPERPAAWRELIVNGDAEQPWAALGLDGVAYNDLENNYKICVWSKEKGVNIDDFGSSTPHPAEIIELADGGHAFICRATLADSPMEDGNDVSAWDNNLWLQSPRAWRTGEQYKLSFRYKASQPVITNTQVHHQTPYDYLYWQAIGNILFDTEWQTYEQVVTVPADANGMWSVAFNLNPVVKTPVDFYIDDLSWCEMGAPARDDNYIVYDDHFEDWTSTNHSNNSSDSHSWTLSCTQPDTKLTFDYSVSSEAGCDNLIVYLDGNQIIYQSGEYSGTYEVQISEGTHELTATYWKDGSVNNGNDEAIIRNITLSIPVPSDEQMAVYVANAISELSTMCEGLNGFDALTAQLKTAIESINTNVSGIEGFNAFKASVGDVKEMIRMAYGVNAKFEELCNLSKSNKELYAVTGNAELGTALTQADALIAAKATLTLESLESLNNAIEAINEAVNAMGLAGSKVWDFNNISQETLTGLNYDSYYIGKWSDYGNYYRNNISNSGYGQLTYTNQNGEQQVVAEAEGLYFNRGGYRWGFWYDGARRLYAYNSGSSYSFMLPELKQGQIITFNYSTVYEGNNYGIARYSDNTMVIAGEEMTTSTAEVTYEVTSDGDAIFYPNGNIFINSITLSVPGDPLRLVALREQVAEYMATLDAFPGLKAELQTAYDNAVATAEGADVEAIIQNLNSVYTNVQKAVEAYPVIVADLETANAVLTEGAYVDISEAVTLGAAIDVNTSKSAEYLAAFEALETSLAIYHADQVDMTLWAFDTNNVYTINGLNYFLDKTNNLAEFVGFGRSNAINGNLNVPATIRLDGTTYCVVAYENIYSYTQDYITDVTLPKSLRRIGDYAFYYHRNLRFLEIPENVTVMGNDVFYGADNLHALKVNATLPPTIGSFSGSSQKKITIPAESFHAYRMASGWNNYVLIGGDGVTVSTGKIAAGELGHIILGDGAQLQEVNKLIVDEGTFNNDDWSTIKSMTNLIEIDLGGVTAANIPSSQFYGKWALEKVVLPHNVANIGNSAFRNTGIKEITFPETLTTLGDYAFQNCDSLRTVSIPGSVNNISYNCFSECDNLQKAELNEGITSIDHYAFQYCRSLSEANLPSTLTSMGECAFDNDPLKKIEIPAGVTEIRYATFAFNNALDTLVIPGTVKTIGQDAFQYCGSLKSVQLSEGIANIHYRAFQHCENLTEVTLPSTLEVCYESPFYGCPNIKKIEARSVIPATTNGYCPLGGVDLTDVVLSVPSWSVSEYTLAEGWSSFFTIEASDYLPENIKVNKDFYFTLREDVAPDYRPNIWMTYSNIDAIDAYGNYNYQRGNLTVSSRSKLAVNNLSLVVSPFAKYYSDENVYYGNNYDYYRTSLNSTSLIVNGEMRAENVCLELNNCNNRWQFVTFPFDVKVSDIIPQLDNTSWVIRGHNGAMRAAGQADSVWVNLTADDVLEAGKGYIMHNYNPDWNNAWFNVYPLKESVNRQLIFASDDRVIELEENLAEFDHNRSWNLIGNPYPCFYDSRFMDFDAPFMVWNSYAQTYFAYNPADDAYILSPGEAFFVQRPFEQESITFRKEGRQTHRYAREMEVYAPAHAKGSSPRVLYNLTLQQDSLADRTRIVFNDAANMGYEMSRDAAKFASSEKSVPQIFTIDGKSRYAINERPFANGDVALGIYCGGEGEFTISLDKTYDCKVVLEDKAMGTFTELSAEVAYTFYAEAGEDLNRFVLHFQGEATGINEISSDNMNGEGAIYNLQGVKMNNTKANGIYIKNGQKTVIK